jgi:bacteriorhodopsin
MCQVPIVMWLIVAASIYVMSLIKNIIVICCIYQPSDVVSPKEIKQKIEFLYICIVVNFEIAWLIYGNSFIFSDKGMQCMRISSDTH